DHGRIWRIRRGTAQPNPVRPQLSRMRSTGLAKHLTEENGWWRDTAQRLLVERNDSAAVQPLHKMAMESPNPRSRLAALWTLEGLGALDIQLLLHALRDEHPRVRENAVRLCEPFLSGKSSPVGKPDQIAALIRTLSALVDDPDPRVRFQLALSLGELNSPERVVTLAQLAPQVVGDKWLSMALLSSVGDHPLPLLIRLLHDNPGWLDAGNDDQAQLLDRLAGIIGAAADEGEMNEVMSILTPTASNPPSPARLSLLAGLADGLAKSNRSLSELTHQSHVYSSQWVQPVNVVIQYAIETADSDRAPLRRRLTAIRVLAGIEPTKAGPVLSNLMLPKHPVEVQMAATRALTEFNDAELAKAIFTNWSQYTRKTRGQLLTSALRSSAFTLAMLDALEEDRIATVEITPYTRTTLMKTQSAEIKRRAERLLQSASSPDRNRVIQEFIPALKLAGDRRHGAALFASTCFVCHTIQSHGSQVGPDLSGAGSHPKDTLLIDILDPNRQVSPDYLSYAIVMNNGETVTGMIQSETSVSVTVRRPSEPDQTIPRSQIKELRAEGRSLMPDGLEQGLTLQDVADVLEFLSQPDATLLPNQN
ncbi:MAG TPA: HEAT repeat domain-containing protein, partial [Candidatus Nitrosotalea sp.]|nr:HEAT repeat domain-containing protein [Candidatus Nitrosotalea sp.]